MTKKKLNTCYSISDGPDQVGMILIRDGVSPGLTKFSITEDGCEYVPITLDIKTTIKAVDDENKWFFYADIVEGLTKCSFIPNEGNLNMVGKMIGEYSTKTKIGNGHLSIEYSY